MRPSAARAERAAQACEGLIREGLTMKTAIAIALVALGAVIVRPLRLEAVVPDPNLKATRYSTSLAQAMDQCTFSITNVGGVAACMPSNSSTEGAFTGGKLLIRARSSGTQVVTVLKSSTTTPPAALAGKTIHTVIVLRVTRTTGSPLVTWVDQTLDCPDVIVPPSGNVKQSETLLDCGLAPALDEKSTNKEILSVQVVDSVSGKVIAVPGVRRKP
jgi:hypothetical protein